MKRKLTKKVRRGLWWCYVAANADFEVTENEHSAKLKSDIRAALEWLEDHAEAEAAIAAAE